MAARELLDLRHVLGPLHERHRDPVDAGVDRGFGVTAILFGHRGDRDHRVGHAHALAIRQPAAGHDLRDGAVRLRLDDPQRKLAVVEEHHMARLERAENFRMRQMHARPIPLRRIGIEGEALAARELDTVAGEGADAQLGTLEVGKDADRPIEAFLELADGEDPFAHRLAGGMAHVDTEHVDARAEKLAHRGRILGCRPERRDDLDAAAAPHFVTEPC